MARMYSVSFTEIAVTAQQDFFQIESLTAPITIHSVYISQSSDVGDAAAENLSIIIRRVTDALTNVTAEYKLNTSDPAASAKLNINDTTEFTAGAEPIHSEAWNIAMPFVYLPPPELRIRLLTGETLTVNLNTTPADSLTVSGVLYFEEG